MPRHSAAKPHPERRAALRAAALPKLRGMPSRAMFSTSKVLRPGVPRAEIFAARDEFER